MSEYIDGKFFLKQGKLQHSKQKIEFIHSPNQSGIIKPEYLILHYTASPSMESSIRWFQNDESNVSAQFLIDWDGTIVQMVKTNRKAWHAGRSNYRGRSGFNDFSIGFELVNPGHLEILGDGFYKSWFGKTYRKDDVVTSRKGTDHDVNIIEGRHPIMGGKRYGWMQSTSEQIESTILLGRYLMNKLDLKECLPHEEISRGRKWDAGLTLPKNVFSMIEGRGSFEGESEEDIYEVGVNTKLNMRAWPSLDSRVIAQLRNGERVDVEDYIEKDNIRWAKIRTFENSMEGWVHSGFLNKV